MARVSELPKKEYICIEYPGIVKNVDKAIETLGGSDSINKAISTQSRYLALNFRPSSSFSHPIHGDLVRTSNLLLKLTKSDDASPVEHEILGTIKQTYKFRGMADFIYFPSQEQKSDVEPKEQTVDIPEETELKLVPALFSKIDLPQDYDFKDSRLLKKSKKDTQQQQQQQQTQNNEEEGAEGPVSLCSFSQKDIPKEGPRKPKKNEIGLYNTLIGLFQTRPIWSRQALEANIPYSSIKFLKALLPLVSYTFSDGPWRNCWVRLGYDPRKNPQSRLYQVIDFRIPSTVKLPPKQALEKLLQANITGEDGTTTTTKTTTTTSSQASSSTTSNVKPRRQKKQAFNLDVVKLAEGNVTEAIRARESREKVATHTFRTIPTGRQNLYQLSDISMDQVQQLLDNKTKSCSKTNGWFDKDTLSSIRKMMLERLKEMISQYNQNGTVLFPASSSGQNPNDEEEVDEDVGVAPHVESESSEMVVESSTQDVGESQSKPDDNASSRQSDSQLAGSIKHDDEEVDEMEYDDSSSKNTQSTTTTTTTSTTSEDVVVKVDNPRSEIDESEQLSLLAGLIEKVDSEDIQPFALLEDDGLSGSGGVLQNLVDLNDLAPLDVENESEDEEGESEEEVESENEESEEDESN
eukprot:TRINITY_DN3616_c0_g3_i1.p1 TRINITY_DN3616_c0_g3~~TRINITY_DN3616_c0_g3_i1.p1  ORF type:complete len:635 (+),score=194.89 TRINITY_DN3616_c0_g3_i1:166-2070(+)